MIKMLVGVKGTGKTKTLIAAANEALENSKGYVVCIEKGATLRHEISYKVRDFVTVLTGKQTIYQCIQLDEEVVKRGGPRRDPLVYKHEYLRRLELRIESRKAALEQGADPEPYLVPGIKAFTAAVFSSAKALRTTTQP